MVGLDRFVTLAALKIRSRQTVSKIAGRQFGRSLSGHRPDAKRGRCSDYKREIKRPSNCAGSGSACMFLVFGLDVQFNRTDQVLRSEERVQIFFGEDVVLEDQVVDATARFERFLSDAGRVLIADYGVKRRYDTDAAVYVFETSFLVGDNAVYATCAQGVEAVHQEVCRFEAALCHYRLHCVKLHLRSFRTHTYAKIVANHLLSNLIHHLGDNRIDLARHN